MAIPTHKLFDGTRAEPQSSSIEAPRRSSKTTRVSVLSSGSQEAKLHKGDLSHDHRMPSRPKMNSQMSVTFGGHRPQRSTGNDPSNGTRALPRRISSLFSGNNEQDSRPSSPVQNQKDLLQSYLERRVEQLAEDTIQGLAYGDFSDNDEELVSIPQWGDSAAISVDVPSMDDDIELQSRPTTVRIKETPRYHEHPDNTKNKRQTNDPTGDSDGSYDDDADEPNPRWDEDIEQTTPHHQTRPSLRSARSVGYRSVGGRSQGSSALSRQMSAIPVEQIHNVFDSQQREQMQDLYMETFMKQLKDLKKHANEEAGIQYKKPLQHIEKEWKDAQQQLRSQEEETVKLKQEIEKLREAKEMMEKRILDSVRAESQSREDIVKERQAHVQTKQEMEQSRLELKKLKMQFGIQEKKMRHSIHFGEVRKTIEAQRPQSTRASRLANHAHFGSFASRRGIQPPKTNGNPIAVSVPEEHEQPQEQPIPKTTMLLSPQAQRIQQSLQRARKSAPEQQLEEGIRRLRAKLTLARANVEHITDGTANKERDPAQRNVKFGPPKTRPLLWSGARKGPAPTEPSKGHQRKKSKSLFVGRLRAEPAKGNANGHVNAITPGSSAAKWQQFLATHPEIARRAEEAKHLSAQPGSDTPKSTTATIGGTPASKSQTPFGRQIRSFGDAMPTPVERKLKAQLVAMEEEKKEMSRKILDLEKQLNDRDRGDDDEKKVEENVAPLPNPNLILSPYGVEQAKQQADAAAKQRRMSRAALELPAKPRHQPKRNMRRLDWKPVENMDLANTIWGRLNDSEVYLDKKDIELNFGEKRRRRRKTSEIPEYKTQEADDLMHWIPEKRRYTVHEALRRFRLSPDEIRRALVLMEDTMTPDTLIKLLDIIPTLDEQNKARIYSNKPREALGFAEYFFAKLSDVAYLRDRIQLWLFKLQFQEIIGQYRNEIAVLRDCLVSIRSSSALPQLLKVMLALGNYINSNSPNKGGAHGFDLTALNIFDKFKTNDGSVTFMTYLVKYCEKYYPGALQVVDQLRMTHDASKITTEILAQNVMDVNGELVKLGRSLKKFTKHPIEIGDQFVPVMKGFHREALNECKTALDEWHEVCNISVEISKLFHLSGVQSVEGVCGVFDNFVSAIRRARDLSVQTEKQKQIQAQNREKIKQVQQAVESRLIVRPRPHNLHAKNIITHESTHKQREEVKRQLSRLVHERSKLLEFQQSQNDGQMTVQRLKYLRDLIKSHETPTNLSNPFDMAQKQRRRRRSLTADEIGIGLSLPDLIREDDEVN